MTSNRNRILHHHARHAGQCHNSPRLHRVIRNVCISAGDNGGWLSAIHPSDIGMNILRILSADPYDLYTDLPAPQSPMVSSYIRADIRHPWRTLLLQQLLLFLFILFVVCLL